MKRIMIIMALMVSLAVTVSAYEALPFRLAEQGEYTVVKIYDGDTFTILVPPNNTINIRINGIDAPERTQEYGLYARALLVNLIGGKPVTIYPIEVDKWGRTVARCFNAAGKDIALEMLRFGMAWHYEQYDDTRAYIEAEQEARYTQTGLWARPSPMNPQKYRAAPQSVKRKNQ